MHDTIRNMNLDDLALVLDWAAAEGWNPGKYDAECFHTADPKGFFILQRDGRAAGAISAVAYDEQFAFLGLYIVRPELRGQGIGMTLWNHAMHALGDRNVGLDGVVAQQANYAKSGFTLAHRNIRLQGTFSGSIVAPNVIPLRQVPFVDILAYDRHCFPADRERFLKLWTTRPGTVALACMQKNTLAGFGVIRPCKQGHKIGPLFCDNPEAAEALLLSLASQAPDTPVYLDIPETNPYAQALVQAHNMTPVFETARMYTKTPPAIDTTKTYGMTTFELG